MATKTESSPTVAPTSKSPGAVDADYLLYIDRERMNAAARVGNPKIERFCNACFTGEYHRGRDQEERRSLGPRARAREVDGAR
ncbi:MAG: hypothetical protein IPK67_19205 [Planctomycetes bacterium]|nr:hypothetical protein [Planctomycetota bacterium]